MLKIMICDTEPENLRNFKTYIRTAFGASFNIVSMLSVASEIHDRIAQYSPDLIIFDMRFFGAKIYQSVRDINDEFPELRFIVYGSYNDADYIRKIFDLGVIDYIFRPVRPADLERSLKKALSIFAEIEVANAEKEKLTQAYNENIGIFKAQFLQNLIRERLSSDFEITESMRYFGISLEPNYTVLNLKIDNFRKLILAFAVEEKHLLIYRIMSVVRSKLQGERVGVALMENFNSVIIILGKSENLYDTIKFADGMKNEIFLQTRIEVSIGVGKAYENPREIAFSYREAASALRYRSYIGYNSVIPIQFVEPENHITYRFPHEKEDMLVYAAVTGEYPHCVQLIDKIIAALRESGPLPENLPPKIVMSVTIAINRYCSEQKLPLDEDFTKFFPPSEILKLDTLDKTSDFLKQSLRKFCDHVIRLRGECKRDIIAAVKKAINERYFENISLLGLASEAGTTAEFLSAIFQESEGQTVYDYAVSIRIDNAKRLLRGTDLDDEFIGIKVGYDDAKHFRSVFKQKTGKTPAEYRHRL